MQGMISGYVEAVKKVTAQIEKVREVVKAAEGFERIKAVSDYRLLCSIRKELKDTIEYLGGYYEKKFAYGVGDFFTDFGGTHERSVHSYGDIRHGNGTERETENACCEGY